MTRARVLIIGSDGQLGSDLVSAFDRHEVVGATHADLEVTDGDQVHAFLAATRPSVVVNTAAYHRTDDCERNPATAFEVNARGPLNLARACEAVGCLLVHISTDYVFRGDKRAPYLEDDPAVPVNVYGVSKVAGELAVRAACSRHYIVRTSGLYGHAACRAKGENFVTKMLRLARSKGEVSVVTDEVLTPTWTRGLARQIASLSAGDAVPFGLVHATDEGQCSWFEFTEEIFRLVPMDVSLTPVTVTTFPSSVPRPQYSVLENAVLKKAAANLLPDWRESLRGYLKG